jgi:hypothetical protein
VTTRGAAKASAKTEPKVNLLDQNQARLPLSKQLDYFRDAGLFSISEEEEQQS